MRSDEVCRLRAQAAQLLHAGATPREVARRLACSRSTVYKVLRLLRSAAPGLRDGRLGNPGRPRLYPEEVWARLMALRRQQPQLGPRQLRQALAAEAAARGRSGEALPAPATIAHALRRAGLSRPQPGRGGRMTWPGERPTRPGTLTLDTWGPWRLQEVTLYLITVQDRFTRLALAYPLLGRPAAHGDDLPRLLAAGWPRALALARRCLLLPGAALDAVYAGEAPGLTPVGSQLPPGARAVLAAGAVLILTPPDRAWPNGRLDRFHGAMEREFWRAEQPRRLPHALAGLRAWLSYFNRLRPHAALGCRAPADRAPWYTDPPLYEPEPPAEMLPRPVEGDIIALRLVGPRGSLALWQGQTLQVSPALAGHYVRVQIHVTGQPGEGRVVVCKRGEEVVVMRDA